MATGFKVATVNAASVPATQTNFPSYVDLSRLGITTLAEAQSVRVYADSGKTTEWAREIVSATEMHVKVPSLTSTVEIFVDWDGSSADYAVTDTYGRNAVWSDYNAVYHLHNASTTDSTGNGNTATISGATATTSKKLIGEDSLRFVRTSSQYMTIPGIDWSSTRSYQILFNADTWVTNQQRVILNNKASSPARYEAIATYYRYDNDLECTMYDGSAFQWDFSPTGSRPAVDTWSNNLVSIATNDARWIVNGSAIGTDTSVTVYNWGATETITIAKDDTSSVAFFNGTVDEIRFKASATTTNWATTENNNQSAESTFWGTWTTVGGGGPTVNSNFLAFM
jgi:hypothetical protein